ncbi:MAG: hypothetical protein HKN95_00615 [Acidimicrobiia bacterium]|nr:hypothetical protein [Acidimicrobiia bacterium]
MKLRVMTVAVLALVGSVLSVPQTSGDSAADQVTVSADFVGIQSDVEGA